MMAVFDAVFASSQLFCSIVILNVVEGELRVTPLGTIYPWYEKVNSPDSTFVSVDSISITKPVCVSQGYAASDAGGVSVGVSVYLQRLCSCSNKLTVTLVAPEWIRYLWSAIVAPMGIVSDEI